MSYNTSPTNVALLQDLTNEIGRGKDMKTEMKMIANSPFSGMGIEPVDMPPVARQSVPMDHDIHIELLSSLFKHIHTATSLPTLAHQFGEFVIEQIEEELKDDIQKKKEFTKYVKEMYRPIVRKKKSILSNPQQDELARAVTEFSDTVHLLPRYQDFETVIDNGYSALKNRKKNYTSKGKKKR